MQRSDEEVREYIAYMLSSRKTRRRQAKLDRQLKSWQSMKEYYPPINMPINLGINAFKREARKRLDKPYKAVLQYKRKIVEAFNEAKEKI